MSLDEGRQIFSLLIHPNHVLKCLALHRYLVSQIYSRSLDSLCVSPQPTRIPGIEAGLMQVILHQIGQILLMRTLSFSVNPPVTRRLFSGSKDFSHISFNLPPRTSLSWDKWVVEYSPFDFEITE